MQGKKEKIDRKRDGKTILRSGQGWTLLAQPGQQKTGLGGMGLLNCHLWSPKDLTRLRDK